MNPTGLEPTGLKVSSFNRHKTDDFLRWSGDYFDGLLLVPQREGEWEDQGGEVSGLPKSMDWLTVVHTKRKIKGTVSSPSVVLSYTYFVSFVYRWWQLCIMYEFVTINREMVSTNPPCKGLCSVWPHRQVLLQSSLSSFSVEDCYMNCFDTKDGPTCYVEPFHLGPSIVGGVTTSETHFCPQIGTLGKGFTKSLRGFTSGKNRMKVPETCWGVYWMDSSWCPDLYS